MITGEPSGGGWRELTAWPPPGTGQRRLYLNDAGALGEQPATASGADGYRYDPADPTPSLGGPLLLERAAVLDNAPLEARDDVLTYTTEPLAETVEAIGHVSVELWARAERTILRPVRTGVRRRRRGRLAQCVRRHVDASPRARPCRS